MLDSSPTPYDFRFGVFRTWVRVTPAFFLVSVVLGWHYMSMEQGPLLVALWVLATFVSILFHELGHVWMGKVFGSDGHIVLYAMGGLAFDANDLRHWWQRVLVSLAGPVIQLLLWAVMWFTLTKTSLIPFDQLPDLAVHFLIMMLWINWAWPLFNLLPIVPLDGGNITREICERISPREGRNYAYVITIATVILVALNSVLSWKGVILNRHLPVFSGFGLMFLASFAVQAYQQMQPTKRHYDGDRLPWER